MPWHLQTAIKTDMREEGIENRARIIWGNVLPGEQYYPILDVGSTGKEVLALGLRKGSGFHFSASASQKRAAKYSFLLSTLPALPTLAQKETGFTQTARRPEQGGWPVYSPISQWALKTHICLMACTSINKTSCWIFIKPNVTRCLQVFACTHV